MNLEDLCIDIIKDCEKTINQCEEEIKTEFHQERLGFLRGKLDFALTILEKINKEVNDTYE